MTPSAPSTGLRDQIRATVEEWRPGVLLLAVRVRLDDAGTHLTACELWCSDDAGTWKRRADLPAGIGATIADLEGAVVRAGYIYGFSTEYAEDHSAAWRDEPDGSHTLDITRPMRESQLW